MHFYNDNNLIEGLIDDNKVAIDLLYKKYHKRIYAFAYSYLKTSDDSLDVVHEVFIKLWEGRRGIRPDTNLDAFVFTVARNTILSMFRKKASEEKYLHYLSSVFVQEDFNTQDFLDYTFLNETINRLIESLPPKRKQIFICSRKDGFSNKEIAKKMNISEKTVEDHITKALAFLRSKMKSIGVVACLFVALFID
jgi:RNA polymerase sigma-70 factor (family 1)